MFKNLSLEALDIKTGLRESLRLASLGRFSGMDVDMPGISCMLDSFSPPCIKGMFQSFNIKAGAWRLPFALGLGKGEFKKAIEEVKPLFDLAAELDFKRALISVSEADNEDVADRQKENLVHVCGIWADMGGITGIEVIKGKVSGRNDSSSLSSALNICKAIAQGNAGLVLETSEMCPDDINALYKAKVVYVKVSQYFTEGFSPERLAVLKSFFGVMKKTGYDGPVTFSGDDSRLKRLPHDISVILAGGSMEEFLMAVLKEK